MAIRGIRALGGGMQKQALAAQEAQRTERLLAIQMLQPIKLEQMKLKAAHDSKMTEAQYRYANERQLKEMEIKSRENTAEKDRNALIYKANLDYASKSATVNNDTGPVMTTGDAIQQANWIDNQYDVSKRSESYFDTLRLAQDFYNMSKDEKEANKDNVLYKQFWNAYNADKNAPVGDMLKRAGYGPEIARQAYLEQAQDQMAGTIGRELMSTIGQPEPFGGYYVNQASQKIEESREFQYPQGEAAGPPQAGMDWKISQILDQIYGGQQGAQAGAGGVPQDPSKTDIFDSLSDEDLMMLLGGQ